MSNEGQITVDDPSEAAPKRPLLLVDDDVLVGRAFCRAVEALGYHADFVTSAGEAVELVTKHPYPVVVTDLQLPGVDGYAVIDAVGSKCPHTAFVIITGNTALLSNARYANIEAVAGLLTKPWNNHELAEKLSLAFELHHKRAASEEYATSESTSVLVVEPHRGDSETLRKLLIQIPHTAVTIARTLAEATSILHGLRFDVVISNHALPDARSVDIVFRLRTSGPTAAIIMCSNDEDPSLPLQLIHLGAQECIVKSGIELSALARAILFAKERKRFELRLAKMAYYDPLTGLANRAGWQERAAATLARASRTRDRVAMMMIDLDGFKGINDGLGHDAGDALLQEIARRLLSLVREYDTVARLGGDEFALLLADIDTGTDLQNIAARVLQEIGKSVHFQDRNTYTVGASIGVATYPETADTLVSLTKRADEAMYTAKRSGKNQAVFV